MLTNGAPPGRDRGIGQGLPRAGGGASEDHSSPSLVFQFHMARLRRSSAPAGRQRTFILFLPASAKSKALRLQRLSNTPRVAKSRAARVILSREMASCRLIAKTSRFQIDLAEAYCRSVFFSCSHKADIVMLRHVISHTRLQGTRTGLVYAIFV
jgi:hypothetical protein